MKNHEMATPERESFGRQSIPLLIASNQSQENSSRQCTSTSAHMHITLSIKCDEMLDLTYALREIERLVSINKHNSNILLVWHFNSLSDVI